MEKNKKKRYGIVAAVVCLALAAGIGTYAWLTAQSSLTNTFTVGSINEPDKKPDPDNPDQPGTDSWDVNGNLIETKWVENSKLTPGATIAKNPNVGIGKNSDDSYVFVYVKNSLVKSDTKGSDMPYFTLNDNWKAVAGETATNGTDGQYVSGLFMYTGGTSELAKLQASGADAFTGEVFSNVVVPGSLTSEMVNGDNPKMTVSAYIFGAGQQDKGKTDAQTALAQAKTWAAEQA